MDSTVEPEEDFSLPPWGSLGRDITLGLVTLGSNLIMHVFNRLSIDGECPYTDQSLFCYSTLDDPILLGAMLPWSFFWTESRHHGTRWSLCAREICYKHAIISHVFQNGKTLPIDRGEGVHQPIMNLVAEKAAQGDWVHVFPEARISYTGRLQPSKRGIGKLVCDSLRPEKQPPVVLPFYHSGMGRILPKGGRIPRMGQAVHVTVGEPVDLRDLLPRCNCNEYEQSKVWSDIAQKISEALSELEAATPPNWDQTAEGRRREASAERSPA